MRLFREYSLTVNRAKVEWAGDLSEMIERKKTEERRDDEGHNTI